MAWVTGAVTMPTVAGADRSGGTGLQMPNVARRQVVGGETWALVANAELNYLGTPYTIPGGVPAICDEGGTILTPSAHYYIVYTLASAPTVLRACWQEHWASAYGTADCIGLAYVTEHYSLSLPQLAHGGCPTINPIPTVLCPTTNAAVPNTGPYTPPADGSLLANANLQALVGMAYDGITGNLILSLSSPVRPDGVSKDTMYKVGSDGIMRVLPGMAGVNGGSLFPAYNGIRDTLFSTIWSPANFVYTRGPVGTTFAAPRQRSMLCSGGKLYTLQEAGWGTLGLPLFRGGRGETYGHAAGLIRSYDLTTGAITTLAALPWTLPANLFADPHETSPSLAMDSSGMFYIDFNAQDWWGFGASGFVPGRPITFEGVVQVAPGAPTYVNLLESNPALFVGLPVAALPTAPPPAWAGGSAVDPTVGTNYADGLARTAGTTGHILALGCDGHDNLLVFGTQLDPTQGHSTNAPNNGILADTYIRSIDAATGQYRTIIGATGLQTYTTPLATYAGLPAYPGDTAVGNDGHASNTTAATWGNASVPPADSASYVPGIAQPSVIVDRAANILYFIDAGMSAIRGIQLDNNNLLCTLIGGPSEFVAAGHGHGEALGPASGMRGYARTLTVDESSGTVYFAWFTPGTAVGSFSNVGVYRAKFY